MHRSIEFRSTRWRLAFVLAWLVIGMAWGGAHAEDDRKSSRDTVKAFEQDCLAATPENLPELIERFAELPNDSTKDDAFLAIAPVWLRAQTFPKEVEFPASAEALSELPPELPEKFALAARRYLQVTAPFRALEERRPPKESARTFSDYRKEYWDMVADILRGRGGPFTERALSFQWGHSCGTGADQFSSPHSLVVPMALMRDGRWPEVVGGLLNVRSRGASADLARAISTMLPHPEEVVAGGIAMEALPQKARWERGWRDLLGLMVVLPGDDRVQLLTELAVHFPAKHRKNFYRVLKKFAPTGEWNSDGEWQGGGFSGFVGFSSDGDNLDSLKAAPVGTEAQQGTLDFLCSQASVELPVEEAETLAHIFREKRHPQTVPALRTLLEHPSKVVADAAAEALTDAGETFVMPPKLGPVRFRITVDGVPYADQMVSWSLSGLGSESKTSVEGTMEISRDRFLDAKDEHSIVLYTEKMPDLSHPWFGVVVPIPRDTDEVVAVDVSTQSQKIVLDLPRPDSELVGKQMEITLSGKEGPEFPRVPFWRSATFVLPAARSFIIPQIHLGTYELWIRVPGFESWSGSLRVGEELRVPLTKASNVKVSIAPREGWDTRAIIPTLLQNGKRVSSDWNYEERYFRGVPPGDYVLHIPSSAETRKKVLAILPPAPDFDAIDIPFTVPVDAPLEIFLP